LKITGHGNPDNNLESHCIIYALSENSTSAASEIFRDIFEPIEEHFMAYCRCGDVA
jgi:hypothetical protein